MEEIDIWRTAAFVLREHGDGARSNAAQRADALYAQAAPEEGATSAPQTSPNADWFCDRLDTKLR